MTTLLEVSDLTYHCGDHVAVSGASFDVESGEILGLLSGTIVLVPLAARVFHRRHPEGFAP